MLLVFAKQLIEKFGDQASLTPGIETLAGKQRKGEASPQFAKIAGNIMPELTDAVGQQGVGSRIALRQSQKCRCGNEGNSIFPRAIKSNNDHHALSTDRHEPMLRVAYPLANYRRFCVGS